MAIFAVLKSTLVVCRKIESVPVQLLAARTLQDICVDGVTPLHDLDLDPVSYGFTEKVATLFDGHNSFSLGETLRFNIGAKNPISSI